MLCRSLIRDDLLEGRKEPILDLESVIEEAAWKALEMPSLCGCRRRPCRRKGLYLRINWSCLERRDVVESFELVPEDVSLKPIQLYRTQFRNFSGDKQVFTFHAQRQTQSSLEMTVQEGISIGGSVNFNFGIPTPEISAGGDATGIKMTSGLLSGQVTWSHSVTDKYTKTETLQWGVDSNVTLQTGQRALASLSVLEAKLVGRLCIRTDAYISRRAGLPVYAVTRKGDEVVAAVDLAANSICKGQRELEETGTANRAFSYRSTALCKAVYGMEQIATVRLLQPGEEEDSVLDGPRLYTEKASGCNAMPGRQGLQIEEIDCHNEAPATDAMPLIRMPCT